MANGQICHKPSIDSSVPGTTRRLPDSEDLKTWGLSRSNGIGSDHLCNALCGSGCAAWVVMACWACCGRGSRTRGGSAWSTRRRCWTIS